MDIETFTHPISGKIIRGIRLSAGSVLCEGDKYNSPNGKWSECKYVAGLTVNYDCDVIWVRGSSVTQN